MPKFKLLRGFHREGGRTYEPGEIIDSKSDLSRHNSRNPHRPQKFQKLEEADSEPVLESMTVLELRKLAEREEVDLENVIKKDEIIQTIRGALAAS